MAVHHWRDISWPAFRALPADRLIAVLPLGALEAHGPHLPLGTDIIIAESMARAGAVRLAGRGFEVALLPALPVAPAPFAAAHAGTLDTPPSATSDLVAAIARNAHRSGVRATVIANAHHDPAHVRAIRAAVRDVETTLPGTVIFPDLTRRRWADRLTDEFRSGACHAGRYESSIVLACEPALVDHDRLKRLPPNPQSLVDAIGRGQGTFAEAGGPDAYFGWPAEATAGEGREIIERLGAIIEEAVLEAITPNENWNGSDITPDRAAFAIVNPPSLGRPVGFSHSVVVPAGWQSVHVAGQTAAGAGGTDPSGAFAGEFGAALGKVIEVVRAAGGTPAHIARMTIYVTDLQEYRASRARLADVWRTHMGTHYPAMALVEVSGLVDAGAAVEIQADAFVPARDRG